MEPNASFYQYLSHHKKSKQVDLLKLQTDRGAKPCTSILIDIESAIDRLYGGYFPDWASGGEWNKMFLFLTNFQQAAKKAKILLTFLFRAGTEKGCWDELIEGSRRCRFKLRNALGHINTRATHPPKLWWHPPTCLRDVMCRTFHFLGLPVFCTSQDFYTDTLCYIKQNHVDALVTDNAILGLLSGIRVFGAHQMKLTYRGQIETYEYFMNQWLVEKCLSRDRINLILALLGCCRVPYESLVEFHEEMSGIKLESTSEDCSVQVVQAIVDFVARFPDLSNLEAIGQLVFRNSTLPMDKALYLLRESMILMKILQTNQTTIPPVTPVKSTIDIPKKAVSNPLKQPSGNGDSSNRPHTILQPPTTQQLTLTIYPENRIIKTVSQRHSQGLMSSIIYQCLIQRGVYLHSSLENVYNLDRPSMKEVFRPVRKSVYSILHNINKYHSDASDYMQSRGLSIKSDDVYVNVTEVYLNSLGVAGHNEVTVTPVDWPAPPLEVLWFGQTTDHKLKRISTWARCMNIEPNGLIMNLTHTPERYVTICAVLRYLLQHKPSLITTSQVDAALSMATSQLIYEPDQAEKLQLPELTLSGLNFGSLIMEGVRHAMLVNDVCGAPIRSDMLHPRHYFSGRVLQQKLYQLKASTPTHLELCEHNMPQVIMMEKLRKAVIDGLTLQPEQNTIDGLYTEGNLPTPKYEKKNHPAGVMTSGIFKARPNLVKTGQLEVAGQVVSSWGPKSQPHNTSNQPNRNGNGQSHFQQHRNSDFNQQQNRKKSANNKNKKQKNKQQPTNDQQRRQPVNSQQPTTSSKNQQPDQSQSLPVQPDQSQSLPALLNSQPIKLLNGSSN